LTLKQFHVEIQDSYIEYTAKATAPEVTHGKEKHDEGARKSLGFMRYSKAAGTVRLSNFKAQLTLDHLKIGKSTKRPNKELAGTHGEGFKLASKVMVDNGYRVRYEASKFYWNVKYPSNQPDELCCELRPVAKKKIEEQMTKYRNENAAGVPRGLTANSWEDVTVAIGLVQGKGKKIDLETFKEWVKISLDLDPPYEAVETDHGTLILDPNFQGRIYLKGLLLELNPPEETRVDTTTKTFRYGYNLSDGKVGRERRRLGDHTEEAKRINRIWEAVIRKGCANIIQKYVDMLQNVSPLADVKYAKELISETTAKSLRQYLSKEDLERNKFYHDDKNRDRVSSCNSPRCSLSDLD